jgi:hypothetical protein
MEVSGHLQDPDILLLVKNPWYALDRRLGGGLDAVEVLLLTRNETLILFVIQAIG